MKLKRILAVVLIFCAVFAFAACGADPDEIAWEGYKNMPFKEFLKEGVEEYMDYDANVIVKEGWDTAELDEADAEEPYTYIVECSKNGKETYTLHFYMDVNDDDLLVAKGGYDKEAGEARGEFNNQRKTKRFLEDLAELKN